MIVKPGANEVSNALAAATYIPFPWKVLEPLLQAWYELFVAYLDAINMILNAFVQAINDLLNLQFGAFLMEMVRIVLVEVIMVIWSFVIIPVLAFFSVSLIAFTVVVWIVENVIGGALLTGPLLGALGAAVVPGVAGLA
ncbi:hypothetical protein B8W66_23785, partial [Mycobacterium decipiens]